MILSLSIGKSLEEIKRMPARDKAQYQRFYAKCPFGPARQDIVAWMTATHAVNALGGKPTKFADCFAWFKKSKRKARKKPVRNPGDIGRRMVEAAQAAGETVIMLKPGEEAG